MQLLMKNVQQVLVQYAKNIGLWLFIPLVMCVVIPSLFIFLGVVFTVLYWFDKDVKPLFGLILERLVKVFDICK